MRKLGFTLMELLVVLAIIGLLAAVIFAALNVSRIRTYDSRVKAQLSDVRKSAELYFNNNNGTYAASVMAAPLSACTGAMFTDIPSGMNNSTGNSGAWPSGTTLSCQATNSAYAISASLHAANPAMIPLSSNYWCVDSTGASIAVTDHIESGDTSCTLGPSNSH